MSRTIFIAMVVCAMLSSFSLCKISNKKLGKSFSGTVTFASCDSATTNKYFTISSVTIAGTPAVGNTVTTTIYGTTTTAFSISKTETVTKLNGIQVSSVTEPISPAQSYAVGSLKMVTTNVLQQDPPAGSYVSSSKLYDASNKLLQCIQLSYKIIN